MTALALYCNCIPKKLAQHQQFNQINLMCGSHTLDLDTRNQYRNLGYQFDDIGNNISHLNHIFGDLTGLYWIWRNTDHEFVGTNQYRRFWSEQEINDIGLTDNTIYVYKSDLGTSLLQQFIHFHGPTLIQLLYESAVVGDIDMSLDLVKRSERINYIYACNMFFCHKNIFNRLCDKFFEIMMEIYQGSRYSLPYIDYGSYRSPTPRGIAFLAERVLTLMLSESQYYLGKVTIQPISVRVL